MKKLSNTIDDALKIEESFDDLDFDVYFEDEAIVFESKLGQGVQKFMKNKLNKKASGAKADINKELADSLKPLIGKIFKRAKQMAGKLAAKHGVPKDRVLKLLQTIKIKAPTD